MTLRMVGCTNERCYLRNNCARYIESARCELLRRYAPDGVLCINHIEVKNDTRKIHEEKESD